MDGLLKSICALEESLFSLQLLIDNEDTDAALVADIEIAERRLRHLERSRPVFVIPQPPGRQSP
jgi:hypothetical protein